MLGRNGMSKLSLSEVALQAGVSRPTLYRWFASKEELLDAFGAWERRKFDNGVNQATAGLRGNERLDAALRFIVDYQQSYSGVRMIDIEPGHVIGQIVNPDPFDGFVFGHGARDLLHFRRILARLRMAIHARFSCWHSGAGRRLDGRVTITAINTVIPHVVLMRKLNRLLPRDERLRDIRRPAEFENEPPADTCQQIGRAHV